MDYLKQMTNSISNKHSKIVFVSSFIFVFCCVEPPEYEDGLLLNIPAIVNEPDFFSFSLEAQDYAKSHSWALLFSGENTDTLYTSVVIKNYSASNNDSTYLRLFNTNNAAIFDILVNTELTTIESIPLEYIGNPSRLEFIADDFSGLINLQLIKQ